MYAHIMSIPPSPFHHHQHHHLLRPAATYTMFKSFLPKICSIPAAAVPISLLGSVGYLSPINGVNQVNA